MTTSLPKSMPNYGRRIRLLGLAVLVALIAYALYWFSAKTALEEALDAQQQDWADQGIDLRFNRRIVSGFPSRLTVTYTEIRARWSDAPGRPGLEIERLMLFSHPWTPDRWIARADEAAFIRQDGNLMDLSFQTDTIQASLRQENGLWHQWDLVADRGYFSLGTAQIKAEAIQAHGKRPLQSIPDVTDLLLPISQTIALRLVGIDRGQAQKASLELRADIRGILSDWSAPTVAAWRDGGGTLEIQSMAMRAGPSRLTAQGSLAVDELFRPFGALTADGENVPQILETFAQWGILPTPQAQAVGSALIALGTQLPAQTPVMLIDGQLSVETVPLTPLPSLF